MVKVQEAQEAQKEREQVLIRTTQEASVVLHRQWSSLFRCQNQRHIQAQCRNKEVTSSKTDDDIQIFRDRNKETLGCKIFIIFFQQQSRRLFQIKSTRDVFAHYVL